MGILIFFFPTDSSKYKSTQEILAKIICKCCMGEIASSESSLDYLFTFLIVYIFLMIYIQALESNLLITLPYNILTCTNTCAEKLGIGMN